MYFLKLDNETTEFVVREYAEDVARFKGTVKGAVECLNFTRTKHTNMSSDLNHPDEFPKFADHAIDIAAGYIDGALKAGLITVDHGPEGTDY